MKTLEEIAEEFHARECFSKGPYEKSSGDVKFYYSCVKDSEEWVTRSKPAVITWDIYCPFCKKRIFKATNSWNAHTEIGKIGCITCQQEYHSKVQKTFWDLQTNEMACQI